MHAGSLQKNAYGLVYARLFNCVVASFPWRLLRTYLESCANIVQAVVYCPPYRPPSCWQSVARRSLKKSVQIHASSWRGRHCQWHRMDLLFDGGHWIVAFSLPPAIHFVRWPQRWHSGSVHSSLLGISLHTHLVPNRISWSCALHTRVTWLTKSSFKLLSLVKSRFLERICGCLLSWSAEIPTSGQLLYRITYSLMHLYCSIVTFRNCSSLSVDRFNLKIYTSLRALLIATHPVF